MQIIVYQSQYCMKLLRVVLNYSAKWQGKNAVPPRLVYCGGEIVYSSIGIDGEAAIKKRANIDESSIESNNNMHHEKLHDMLILPQMLKDAFTHNQTRAVVLFSDK